MASHNECDHPATPAARGKCRAAGGPFAMGGVPIDIDTEGDHPELGPVTWTVVPKGRQRSTKGGIPAGYVRTPDRPAKADSVALKRPNERLRTIGDLTDVPPALAVVVRAAWDRDGWEARVGSLYVHDERRVLVTTPHGELSLVWKSDRPAIHGVFFRDKDSSVTRRIDTVNGAMRLANGEPE